MKRNLVLIGLLSMLCWTCKWSGFGLYGDEKQNAARIDRYDRVIDEYVSLGSGTALHRMNTEYTQQTKLLIEQVLNIGNVFDPGIEHRLREYYMDSVPQLLLAAVHEEFLDMSDIEEQFENAFDSLSRSNPDFRLPHIYTQVSCLGQKIVVSDTLIGISLDMYLGADFPLYADRYGKDERQNMTRTHIVADAVAAYTDKQKQH